MKAIKIFLVAGEISGDRLGGRLMHSLKKQARSLKISLEFHGIGGNEMIAEGLNLTYPMKNIGLIGLIEVLPHLMKLISIIKSTAKIIDNIKPSLVITIDSWDFSSRIVKLIKPRNAMKLVHYVSPSIWAHRPKRAIQLESLYDLLLCIFPFEPKYYTKNKVKCTYIGHPLVESFAKTKKQNFLKKKYNLNRNIKILGVMAGSREREIIKILPIFIEAVNKFLSHTSINKNQFLVVFPTVNKVIAKQIISQQSEMNFNNKIIDISTLKEVNRIDMLKSFDLALTKSGTSSLELTLAKVPMIVAYKINYLSELVARYVFKLNKNIKYVSMTNILLDRPVIEEFLQDNCNATNIATSLLKLLKSSYRKQLLLDYNKVVKMLDNNKNIKPSDLAAKNILKLIE